jgi:hypothetical protein
MTRDFHMNCRNLRNIDSYTQQKPMHVNTRTASSLVNTRTLKSFFFSEILDITFYPGKVVNWYIKTYGTKTNIEVRKSNSNNSETFFRKRTTKVVRCHWDPCLEFKRLGSHVVVELSEVLFKFVEAKTTWNVPLLLQERVLLLCTGVVGTPLQ